MTETRLHDTDKAGTPAKTHRNALDATDADGTGKPSEPNAPAYGKGSRFYGKPGRSGPPKGNENATRHGMRGSKLPKGCAYIENRVNSLRRQVECALIEAKGEISIIDAAGVNSVLKWERHGLLAAHWLRKEADKLSVSDRLKFSEAIARASDARDKALRSLGLDAKPAAPWLIVANSTDAAADLEDK